MALGRCITRDAALFLVDEPFANLDQALRERYRVNLKILLRQFSITTVYVTHDHHEALILADLVAVMDRGRIEQVGTPQAIYDEPKNVFVAGFLNVNIGTPPLSLIDASELPEHRDTAGIVAGVRPEDVEITPLGARRACGAPWPARSAFRCATRSCSPFVAGEQEIHAQISGGGTLRPGDDVGLRFKQYHLFDKASGARLRSYQRPLQG